MTKMWKRYGLVALLLGATMPLAGQTATAQTATSITIGSVTVGTDVSVSGALAYGADAAAPIQIAEDAPGDDADGGRVPQGTDLGNASIATDLAGRKLVFSFAVNDLPPTGKIAPTYSYVWPFSVNANDEGRFLSSGTASSWSGAGPIVDANGWFRLCQIVNGAYSCPNATTGTMGNGKVEINLPFNMAAVRPGALIDVGGGSCGTLCATYNPTVTLLGSPNADSAALVGYQMPGEVKLGIAPATAADASVATPVTAVTVMPNGRVTGTFSGSLPKPATPGEYKVVAKTCFGNVEAPVCSVTSSPFSIV